MIQIGDIVKVKLPKNRVFKLQQSDSDLCRRLSEANGCYMRVGGITHLQEPEEMWGFVLEYMDDPYPPYVFASFADLQFIRHEETPPKRTPPVDVTEQMPEGPSIYQLELFGGAA